MSALDGISIRIQSTRYISINTWGECQFKKKDRHFSRSCYSGIVVYHGKLRMYSLYTVTIARVESDLRFSRSSSKLQGRGRKVIRWSPDGATSLSSNRWLSAAPNRRCSLPLRSTSVPLHDTASSAPTRPHGLSTGWDKITMFKKKYIFRLNQVFLSNQFFQYCPIPPAPPPPRSIARKLAFLKVTSKTILMLRITFNDTPSSV